MAMMSAFPVQVEEAAAAGPMNATAFDEAEAEESKTEGRRMRSLSNEQHFRRSSGMTTGKYALSGFRQSAVTFIKIAGLHPNLAAGFRYIAKARQGSFIK